MSYLYEILARCRRADSALDTSHGVHTYGDLLDRAAELEVVLGEHGVTPGTPVGLAPLDGLDLYASVAVLSRLGCAVVTFAANDPVNERRRLSRLGVRHLVVAGADGRTTVEALDIPAAGGARVPAGCAYVISTSGSTASPKNVPISDDNLRSFGAYVQGLSCLSARDRMAQNYTTTFDGFFLIVVLAWSSGACVVLPRLRENLLVATFVEERGVTVWNSVPSQLRLARRLGRLGAGSMPGLRLCVLAGEPLLPDLVAELRAAAPGATVVNLYGPSEVTIGSTTYVVAPGEELRLVDGKIPIGPVFPQVESLLVPADTDEDGTPLFELCLRGPQRLVGYADPADDVGRFYAGETVADLVATDTPDERSWYRSGDLVTPSEFGLVYQGRRTREVKVMGRRIDLAKVEAALLRDPRVLTARALVANDQVVAVVEGEPGDGAEIAAGELRPYARPARVVWTPAMPTLPNGKTDMRAVDRMVDDPTPTTEERTSIAK
ncbi:AMP-binding protein [Actinoplanes sp. NPDC051859]|uniref:AMP-binding protein n=1 Tax=Actinoplanes sp. NPDC051859 TaxID=3363909 RepID=UPI0037B63C33